MSSSPIPRSTSRSSRRRRTSKPFLPLAALHGLQSRKRQGSRQQASLFVIQARRLFLPFAADLVESVGAQLELLTQPAQDRRLFAERLLLEGARDVVGALALLAEIDEVIARHHRAQPVERL